MYQGFHKNIKQHNFFNFIFYSKILLFLLCIPDQIRKEKKEKKASILTF